MAIMRRAFLVIGTLAVLMGLLWVGQGLGLIRWPASSFMLGDPRWAINGSITTLIGIGLVWFGARDGGRGK
ncbi:MAG: hypothetical protein KGM18_02785 [Sphingomonadales bacterium]|nr:hypothetical protein [Sphingomonadales bacterium]